MAQVAQKQREVLETQSMDKSASKHFVKRMLAIGISNIIYLRNIFPESAFADRKIDELRLKILKEEGHEGANRIVQWMKGVYDALDNEYLRALIFAIVSDKENPESVIESYTFCFTYNNGAVQASLSTSIDTSMKSSVPSTKETLESAKKFLRNLVCLTSTMENLPPNVFMTVRLLYYDNVTPCEYQPPGFIEAIEKDTLGFVVDNIRLKLGHIITPHTCMKVRVRAPKSQFEAPEKGMKSDLEITNSQMTIDSAGDSKIVAERSREMSSEIGPKGDFRQKTPKLDEVPREEVEEDLGVRCPCLDPADDGTMILCSICNYWQHAICFCLYDEANMPETHVCHLCSDKHTHICTDPRLNGIRLEQQHEMCAWRRILQYCFNQATLTLLNVTTQLASTKSFAMKILSRLVDEKVVIVIGKGSKTARKVDYNRLKVVFERDVAHVGNNLQLQRNDNDEAMYLDDESSIAASPAPKGKRKAARSVNDSSTAAVPHKLAIANRLRSSPMDSQSSAYVFRSDSNQQPSSNARKRRRLSKSEALSGRK